MRDRGLKAFDQRSLATSLINHPAHTDCQGADHDARHDHPSSVHVFAPDLLLHFTNGTFDRLAALFHLACETPEIANLIGEEVSNAGLALSK